MIYLIEIADKYPHELLNDLPIEFYGLQIYPIMMSDFLVFCSCMPVLELKKNEDVNFISKSNLDYLIYNFEKEKLEEDSKKIYSHSFYSVISLCLRKDINISYTLSNGKNKASIAIDGIILSPSMYNDLIQIMVIRNFPEYKLNRYIDSDLEKDIQETSRLKNKNKKRVSIEKQQALLAVHSSYTFEYIRRLSIRKFFYCLEMIEREKMYELCTAGEYTGNVTFKSGILHYFDESITNELDSFMSKDDLDNKINSAR